MAGRIFGAALAQVLIIATACAWSPTRADDNAKTIAELRFELSVWRKVLATREDEWADERASVIRSIRGVSNPRAVPILADLWDKENEPDGSFLVRGYYLEPLIRIGNGPAFRKLAEISVEDRSFENRSRAAKWIGEQDNRNDAIPIYVRYIRSKDLCPQALTALDYSQIATRGKRPPSRQLVAALIDNLITVTQKRKRVRNGYSSGWHMSADGSGLRDFGWQAAALQTWETECSFQENPTAHELLCQYTREDYGFDQQAWRRHVLRLPSKDHDRQSPAQSAR